MRIRVVAAMRIGVGSGQARRATAAVLGVLCWEARTGRMKLPLTLTLTLHPNPNPAPR